MTESKYKLVPVEPTKEMLDKLFSAGQGSEITRFRAMLAAAPSVNPWVSVKDKLPTKEGMYFCYLDEFNFPVCVRFWSNAVDVKPNFLNQGVTHWWDELIMPIPRPKI